MRTRDVVLFAGGCVALAAAVSVSAMRLKQSPAKAPRAITTARLNASSTPTLRVPRVLETIVADGELTEALWTTKVARTEAFANAFAQPGKPYSDARIAWGNGKLYIALYAADEDIQASAESRVQSLQPGDDRFLIEFASGANEYAIELNPNGVYRTTKRSAEGGAETTWNASLTVGRDLDGTLNDPTDDDEEWLLEIVLPLSSLGLQGATGEALQFSVERCDTPHRGARACNAWPARHAKGTLVLE